MRMDETFDPSFPPFFLRSSPPSVKSLTVSEWRTRADACYSDSGGFVLCLESSKGRTIWQEESSLARFKMLPPA